MEERFFTWTTPAEMKFQGTAKFKLLSYPEKIKLRAAFEVAKITDPELRKTIDENALAGKMYDLCKELIREVDMRNGEIHITSLEELMDFQEGEIIMPQMAIALVIGRSLPK